MSNATLFALIRQELAVLNGTVGWQGNQGLAGRHISNATILALIESTLVTLDPTAGAQGGTRGPPGLNATDCGCHHTLVSKNNVLLDDYFFYIVGGAAGLLLLNMLTLMYACARKDKQKPNKAMAQQMEDALSKIAALEKVIAASAESNPTSIPNPMHVNEENVTLDFSIPGAPKRKKSQRKRSMLV